MRCMAIAKVNGSKRAPRTEDEAVLRRAAISILTCSGDVFGQSRTEDPGDGRPDEGRVARHCRGSPAELSGESPGWDLGII